MDLPADRHGFFSRSDLPVPRDEHFVVVVLGGSVAHWLALMAAHVLEERLGALDAADGRPVRVLNLASGGYKQPQALRTTELLRREGQSVDLAVVVDGFNEVALGLHNLAAGFDPLGPSVAHVEDAGLDVAPYRLDSPPSTADALADIVSAWAQSTRRMHRDLVAAGATVLHALQPNQYASAKSFTEEERRLALSETTPYRAAVEAGYPHLRRAVAELAADGLAVHDATGVFDDVTETVFIDNCCHVNGRGSEILAGWLLDRLDRPEPRPGPLARAHRRLRRRRQQAVARRDGPPPDIYPLW